MDDMTKDAVKEMLEGITETMRQTLANDEIFSLGAKVQKKSLDAMLNEGFTRKEAILIMASGKQQVGGK